jgi:Mce-associated membrane protein
VSDNEPAANEVVAAPVERGSGGRHRREAPSRSGGARRSRSSAATLGLALLCLPVAAAAIVFWLQTPSSPTPPSLLSANSSAAVTSAKASVHTILSYDYRAIDANIASAKAATTGVFAHQYAGTASQLLSEAKQAKAIVQATIGSSGVVSASPTNVVVLLFVDQASVRQVKGQKTPTTRIDQSRVQVTMTLVGGKWLVSNLAAL